MPLFTETPEQGPVTPHVEGLLHGLSGFAFHCAIGLILGAVAARQMRSRHLHWNWALFGLGLAVLTREAAGAWAPTLILATLLAARRGRRWHREDLEAGSDLAAVARLRSGPLDLLRSLAASLGGHAWAARFARPGETSPDGGPLVIGKDARGRHVTIPIACGSARHTLVVGATGSGKTVTQALMTVRSIERGAGAIVIDPKGDERLRSEVQRASASAGKSFLEWTPEGPLAYNPYARGSETEIADKALAGERFTEPHYLRQAQRYLGHVVRVLRAGREDVTLAAIVECLDPDRLELLAREIPESLAVTTHAYLDSLTTRQRNDLAGVRDRLAVLAESDVGPWLDPDSSEVEGFDLLEAIRRRAVVYFSLEADRRPLLAQMLGSAIVQDLQTAVAVQQRTPAETIVVIDEFSAVAAEQVVRLFGRARSAGVSLLLGTQELSDLRLPGRERLLEQVMGNLSVLIAHRQVVPSSAELIAGVAGSRGAWKVSTHSDGRSTRTRGRESVLDPSDVMGLAPGWAAVITLERGAKVDITHVLSPNGRA